MDAANRDAVDSLSLARLPGAGRVAKMDGYLAAILGDDRIRAQT